MTSLSRSVPLRRIFSVHRCSSTRLPAPRSPSAGSPPRENPDAASSRDWTRTGAARSLGQFFRKIRSYRFVGRVGRSVLRSFVGLEGVFLSFSFHFILFFSSIIFDQLFLFPLVFVLLFFSSFCSFLKFRVFSFF